MSIANYFNGFTKRVNLATAYQLLQSTVDSAAGTINSANLITVPANNILVVLNYCVVASPALGLFCRGYALVANNGGADVIHGTTGNATSSGGGAGVLPFAVFVSPTFHPIIVTAGYTVTIRSYMSAAGGGNHRVETYLQGLLVPNA